MEKDFVAEVMSVVAYEDDKKNKKKYELKFTHKGIYAPHNDALVLTVNINTFDVRRVLIDPGSLSEIIYHSLFEKLKLPSLQINSVDSPDFSFSGEAIWPIAIAEVPVRLGHVKKNIEFIVMNIDSPYTAILGRGWLGIMKVVASPLHQKLKFPSKEGIVLIRGKQEDARYCFGLAVQFAMAEKRHAELAESLQARGKGKNAEKEN